MLLRLLKVRGHSLDPIYHDGDYVLVSRVPLLLRGIRPGDAVVFQHSRHGKLIKLVEHLEDQGRGVFLVGLDDASIDSRQFGAVPREQILGAVIWHIPKN